MKTIICKHCGNAIGGYWFETVCIKREWQTCDDGEPDHAAVYYLPSSEFAWQCRCPACNEIIDEGDGREFGGDEDGDEYQPDTPDHPLPPFNRLWTFMN